MPGASEGAPSEWCEQRCEKKGINEARGGQRHPFRNRPPARVARRVRRTVRGGRGERIRLARRRRLAVGVPRAVRRAHAGRPHHLAGPARAPRHQPADAAPRRHRQRHRECRRGVGRQVHRSTRRVPVYLAAEGPRTLELAGRIADGVIVGLGLTPDVIRLSLAAIERGARVGGRTLGDLDVWWFAKSNVADTRAEAVAPITMALAASANHAFRFTLEGKGVPLDLHEKIRALQREYDAHHHEIAGGGNAGLTDRWGLTEFLLDRFAIAGTPDDCVAQIRRAVAAGARQFVITSFVPDRRAFVHRWMREVAAAVR